MLVGLPVFLSVGHGKANSGSQSAAPGTGEPARISAPALSGARASTASPVAATTQVVPFTIFDLFLLVGGGVVLLVLGANVGRSDSRGLEVGRPEPARAEVQG
jgi:hypothetical protein